MTNNNILTIPASFVGNLCEFECSKDADCAGHYCNKAPGYTCKYVEHFALIRMCKSIGTKGGQESCFH